jgi:hypothetical protein
MDRLVAVTFAAHVSAHDVASWLTALGACGVVRVNPENDRRCVIRVRRAGAMEYLETLLARGEKLGVLAWQAAAPEEPVRPRR